MRLGLALADQPHRGQAGVRGAHRVVDDLVADVQRGLGRGTQPVARRVEGAGVGLAEAESVAGADDIEDAGQPRCRSLAAV